MKPKQTNKYINNHILEPLNFKTWTYPIPYATLKRKKKITYGNFLKHLKQNNPQNLYILFKILSISNK